MAWRHSLFQRATDKELAEAAADTFLPDFCARIVRTIGDEQERRRDAEQRPRSGASNSQVIAGADAVAYRDQHERPAAQ